VVDALSTNVIDGTFLHVRRGTTTKWAIPRAASTCSRTSPASEKRSLRDLPPAALDGRRALVRVDFNVPFKDGAVTTTPGSAPRFPPSPTCGEGRAGRAAVALRPPQGPDPKASLKQIVRDVERILGTPVEFIPIRRAASRPAAAPRGGVALVENTRFWQGEEANDAAFAHTLAALGDFYVNDAFGSAHRAHASTEAVARLLPAPP